MHATFDHGERGESCRHRRDQRLAGAIHIARLLEVAGHRREDHTAQADDAGAPSVVDAQIEERINQTEERPLHAKVSDQNPAPGEVGVPAQSGRHAALDERLSPPRQRAQARWEQGLQTMEMLHALEK